MAPKTRAMSVQAGADNPTPKQTIKSKLNTNTKRCSHCGAPVRSEETETKFQDTAKHAANVSAAPVNSIEQVGRESTEVPCSAELPEWNGRRRRSGQTRRDELEVADFLVTQDFCTKWASGSAAATMVHMNKDPNYFAPVQKNVSSKAGPDSTGPSFIGIRRISIQAYSTMASSSLQPKYKHYG